MIRTVGIISGNVDVVVVKVVVVVLVEVVVVKVVVVSCISTTSLVELPPQEIKIKENIIIVKICLENLDIFRLYKISQSVCLFTIYM